MLAWPVAIDTPMGLVVLAGKRNAGDVDREDPYHHWRSMNCALKHRTYLVAVVDVREDMHAVQTHRRRLGEAMTYRSRL